MVQTLGKQGDGAWIGMKGSIADDAGRTIVQIQHRREAQVNANANQFAANGLTQLGRTLASAKHVKFPHRT